MRSLSLLLLLACSGGAPPKETAPPESKAPDSAHTGTSDSAGAHDTAPYIEGPVMEHAPPDALGLCFDCHLCATEDAPVLETTHWVCVSCHRGPDGSVPDEVQSDCGCGALDCSADPAVVPCNDCHTDGTNGQIPATEMNELCSHCHAAAPSRPAPHVVPVWGTAAGAGGLSPHAASPGRLSPAVPTRPGDPRHGR